MDKKRQCTQKTLKGERCKSIAKKGDNMCYSHRLFFDASVTTPVVNEALPVKEAPPVLLTPTTVRKHKYNRFYGRQRVTTFGEEKATYRRERSGYGRISFNTY